MADLGGGLFEIGEGTLEELLVGKDGERGGARRRKGAGEGGRVKVAAQEALGRRGFLDLGDDGRPLRGGAA